MGCITSRRTNNGEKENNSNVKHLDNLNTTNKPINNSTNNNLPVPRPPKRQKKDILPDVSVLRHIDEHVMTVCCYVTFSISDKINVTKIRCKREKGHKWDIIKR